MRPALARLQQRLEASETAFNDHLAEQQISTAEVRKGSSAPFRVQALTSALPSIPGMMLCRSKRRSGPGRDLSMCSKRAPEPLSALGRSLDPCIDFISQRHKVDWLGQESLC